MLTRRVVIIGIAMLALLILLFIVLFFIISKKPSVSNGKTVVVSFSPKQMTLMPGSKNSVDIMVDTHGTRISGVQAVLSYDPTIIQNVTIASASDSFFGNSNDYIVFPTRSHTPGIARYAISINLHAKPRSGTGKIATVSFQINPLTSTHSTALRFFGGKNGTLITQLSHNTSVLQSASSLNITIK